MTLFTSAEIAAVVTKDDGRTFLVAMQGRLGAASLAGAIEWYWYPPNTDRNRLFDIYFTDWEDLRWMVIAFPAGRLDEVKRLAKQLGLRLANGVPTMFSLASKRPSDIIPLFFPGERLPNGRDNMAMMTIENDAGSPVYQNRKRDHDGMLQADFEINDALNRGVRLTPAQIADYIYGPGFPLESGTRGDASTS